MRKKKKIAALAMSLCFAFLSVVGCTNKSSTDSTTEGVATAEVTEQAAITTEAVTTLASDDKKATTEGNRDEEQGNESSETKKDASGSRPTSEETANTNETNAEGTKEPVTFEDIDTNSALTGFLNMMEGVDAVKMKFEMNMNVANAYPGEWSLGGTDGIVKLILDCQWDIDRMIADGSVYMTVDTDTVKFNDELLRFAVDRQETQIATKLPDLLADLLGGSEQIDVMLSQFGAQVTFADLQRVCNFTIPMGSAVLNSVKVDETARGFVLEYLTRLLNEVDARSITGSGNDITMEINGAFLSSLLRSAAKNTKDSDYEFFFKYLQESGTPSYNEAEFKAAIDRLSEQINKGLTRAGSLMTFSPEDLLDFADQLYEVISDEIGTGMYADESEMQQMIRSMFQEASEHMATRDAYEKVVAEYDQELSTVFKDGCPKIRIRYDDKAKSAEITASFVITDEATGEKIDLNCALNMEKTTVELRKIPDTVELSEVVYVGCKLYTALQNLMGPMMGLDMSGFDIRSSFSLN
ncbi:MAG: hypothetical protein IK125_01805 [Lachnospiraceae bacterium]|nr:hypothetical protein [Lachnospiraceae bacterium]